MDSRFPGSQMNRLKECCWRGHPLSGDNVYVNTAGKRECRTCHRNRQKAYSTRQRKMTGATAETRP